MRLARLDNAMIELQLNGETPVPPGKLASIVTALHMLSPPESADLPNPIGVSLSKVLEPEVDPYLALFRQIGADWLWFSRLAMPVQAVQAILSDPAVEIIIVKRGDAEIGLLELDFRQPGDCEIAFFGFVPGETGKGLGGWLMNEGLRRAWREGINRVWIHTCTMDHPAALTFYRRHGFVVYERAVEIVDDPRLTGVLPRDAASHVSVID